jgi:FkbM family methyltransferase
MTSWIAAWTAMALLAIAFAIAAVVIRRKHRQTWTEIFRLRQQLDALHAQLVGARKDVALLHAGETRLPPRMPSQNGEDLLLWEFFDRKRTGFFVDVGAYDGVGFSNSYFFESIGWTGVLIEAAPELFAQCVAARPNSVVVHAAAGASNGSVAFTVAEGENGVATLSSMAPDHARIAREGGRERRIEVPLKRLDDILAGVIEQIDFISIDVEGTELDVLQGFDLDRFRPHLLVIEDNSGGADARVGAHLAAHGYKRSFQVEQNVFYTRHDEQRTFRWDSGSVKEMR